MHLHSFTYDFHVRVLSERLSKLVQKENTGKRNNYGHNLSMLLENRNIVQDNTNDPPEKKVKKKKNAIAGFLDDYLKYYNLPPLYSSCLVLAGTIILKPIIFNNIIYSIYFYFRYRLNIINNYL